MYGRVCGAGDGLQSVHSLLRSTRSGNCSFGNDCSLSNAAAIHMQKIWGLHKHVSAWFEVVAACGPNRGRDCRMSAPINRASRALAYKRLASQCIDAQQLVKAQKISRDVADEISRLARLLLRSIDLHCSQRAPRINAAIRTRRAEAQSALRRLRHTIRAITEL